VECIRSPNADLGRDPRWGRTEECYGEDAYFNGEMVVAFVKAAGRRPEVLALRRAMKHFLANSNENDRDKTSSDFDERLFREYSAPFRWELFKAVRALYGVLQFDEFRSDDSSSRS
jgi:beta-glucosidase